MTKGIAIDIHIKRWDKNYYIKDINFVGNTKSPLQLDLERLLALKKGDGL